MKVLVLIGAAVAAVVAFFAVLGWATPRRHEVSGEREIDASREQVYDLVRALEDYPKTGRTYNPNQRAMMFLCISEVPE